MYSSNLARILRRKVDSVQSGEKLLLEQLIKKYSAVPNPRGDFVPHPILAPVSSINITPYGYESLGGEACFEFRLPVSPEARMFTVKLQFTSFPIPLDVRLSLDTGLGFCEENQIPVPITESGRAYISFSTPSALQGLRIYPHEAPVVFALHDCSITSRSPAELGYSLNTKDGRPIDILCFPIIDWEYRFQRPQQILSLFGQDGHRVFYVGTEFLGVHVPSVREKEFGNNVTGLWLPGNPRLNLYRDRISENTRDKALLALERFLHSKNCHEALVFLDLPFWYPIAAQLKDRYGWRIVYDCMDDHSGFENNDATMLSVEQESIAASDLLIVSSEGLRETHAQKHKNTILVRNAGDYDHFSVEIQRKDSPIQHLPGPVIGYYGAVAEWFDVSAIEAAAHAFPDASFAIIGGHDVNASYIKRLGQIPNVYLLGEKPYRELPSFLAGFDVCTIPFRRIPLTEATNPVKIYEYFATGKPIVARELPELEQFRELVHLYRDEDEFVSSIRSALLDLTEDRWNARRDISVQNTWFHRYRDITERTTQLYPKVAIIVISYQQLECLDQCVTSILANTQYPNFEIIIVDNGSEDDVVRYLDTIKENTRIRVILNGRNRGFAAANNQGLREADDAAFFVLLNNDTVVPPGWLSRLLWYAKQSDIGMVGPVTNNTGNEARIPVLYSDLTEMEDFAREHCYFNMRESFDITSLAMYCVVFRKEVLEKVGFLDEGYQVGMFEDDDYAERVRRAGFRVVCAEDSFVHHHGSKSFSKLDQERYNEIFNSNRVLFESKWGPWKPHKYR